MSSIDIHIGDVLRRRREEASRSLSEAATGIGIGEDELQRIEAAYQRASAEKLLLLCRYYGIAPAELYNGVSIEADEIPIGQAAQ